MNNENKTKWQLINELAKMHQRMAQLDASAKRYSALIENSPDISYILDPKGDFVFVGGALKSLLGFTPEELIGKHFYSILRTEDVNRAEWHFNERRARGRFTRGFEVLLVTKKGKKKHFDIKYLPVELHAFGFYDKLVSAKDKKFLETYGVAKKISRRKRMEEALRRSNKKLLKERSQRIILSKRLVNLLEKDRCQTARELHDHIGQNLISLKMQIEMIHNQLNTTHPELQSLMKNAKDKAIQVISDLRNLAHGLKPEMLNNLGLIPSLRSLFDEIKRSTGIEIHFFTKGVPKRFNPENELALYRITQEAINNIIKHARATEVFISLIKKEKPLSLSVEDNGVGFEVDHAMKVGKGALGLLIMQERAEQLGGKLSMESRLGKGTHILVEIPL